MLSLLIYWTDLDAFPPMLFSRSSATSVVARKNPWHHRTRHNFRAWRVHRPIGWVICGCSKLGIKKKCFPKESKPLRSHATRKKRLAKMSFLVAWLTVTDYLHMFFQGVPRCMISDACNNFFVNKNQPRVDPRKHARTGELAASC